MFKKFKGSAANLAGKAKGGANYFPDDMKDKVAISFSETSERILSKVKGSPSDDLSLNDQELREELDNYEKTQIHKT